LRIQGLPEATDISRDLVDNLLQWISHEGAVPLFDNKKPPSARDRRTALSLTSSLIPDHLVVKECGNVELNGRYQVEQYKFPTKGFGSFREYNGAPVYTKKGEWKGKKVTFAIFREVYSSKPIAWYIGRSDPLLGLLLGHAQEEKRILFKCQTNRPLPPFWSRTSPYVIISCRENYVSFSKSNSTQKVWYMWQTKEEAQL